MCIRDSLEDGHLGDDQLRRPGQGETHDTLWPGPACDQRVREAVRPLVQLGVGENGVLEDQGHGVRAQAHLLGEHLGPGERRDVMAGVVPLDEDAVPLLGGQRFQFGDGDVRPGQPVGQQSLVVPQHPIGGRAFDQVGPVRQPRRTLQRLTRPLCHHLQ